VRIPYLEVNPLDPVMFVLATLSRSEFAHGRYSAPRSESWPHLPVDLRDSDNIVFLIMSHQGLGEFEQLVLLAIVHLDGDA